MIINNVAMATQVHIFTDNEITTFALIIIAVHTVFAIYHAGDQFDWTKQNKPTGTGSTGPDGDHTSGSGYYMFIETSSPRRNNDKAQLQSPKVAKQR